MSQTDAGVKRSEQEKVMRRIGLNGFILGVWLLYGCTATVEAMPLTTADLGGDLPAIQSRLTLFEPGVLGVTPDPPPGADPAPGSPFSNQDVIVLDVPGNDGGIGSIPVSDPGTGDIYVDGFPGGDTAPPSGGLPGDMFPTNNPGDTPSPDPIGDDPDDPNDDPDDSPLPEPVDTPIPLPTPDGSDLPCVGLSCPPIDIGPGLPVPGGVPVSQEVPEPVTAWPNRLTVTSKPPRCCRFHS